MTEPLPEEGTGVRGSAAEGARPQEADRQETPEEKRPGEKSPAGLFVRRRPGEEFGEPETVPRWMVSLGESARLAT